MIHLFTVSLNYLAACLNNITPGLIQASRGGAGVDDWVLGQTVQQQHAEPFDFPGTLKVSKYYSQLIYKNIKLPDTRFLFHVLKL
jgi:hypothetical protein